MSLHEQMGKERAWTGKRQPGTPEGADVEKAALGTMGRIQDRKDLEYMPFNKAVDWVRDHQPDFRSRPKIATDLRNAVAERCVDKDTPVKFFTAIGSPLDFYHGVDAFIEQGNNIATIDISMQEKETLKADVLLVATMDRDGEVTVNKVEMLDTAERIANKLNRLKLQAA